MHEYMGNLPPHSMEHALGNSGRLSGTLECCNRIQTEQEQMDLNSVCPELVRRREGEWEQLSC